MYIAFEKSSLNREFIDDLCYRMCVSALIAPSLFSFGELLRHPIAEYIKTTSNKTILLMIESFNNGDISGYQEYKSQCRLVSSTTPQNYEVVLEQKVRMMSLLTLIYESGANQLSFNQIAERTKIQINE